MQETRVPIFIRLSAVIFLSAAISAQAPARVAGKVSGPKGPLANATVRARNLSTGDARQAVSAADGSYALELAAGSYDLFVSLVEFGIYTKRDIALSSGQTMRVDVTLAEGGNIGIPGENAFGLLRLESRSQNGETQRTADGKPNLSGVWFPSLDLDSDEPVMRPWAAQLQRERAEYFGKDDPRAHCLPSGVVRTHHLDLTKIVQTPELIVILIEGAPPGFRQIFMDGRPHPPDFPPSWMGHSIGHWEAETLVVDTVGFNEKGWLQVNGRPQTEQLHVIERFRRPDLGHLEMEITVDDPGAYERPWKIRRVLDLAGDQEIHEYVCNENEKPEHLVGK